jgi:ubiquinone/menaquinone biosynthesis C-methylase UbiE
MIVGSYLSRWELTMRELRLVSATDASAQSALTDLDRRMAGYYGRSEIADYYQLAHCANEKWQPGTHHWLVREQVRAGMSVVDLGCGSGHAFENLKDLGARYTGVDWSEKQLQENARRYGDDARFVAASLYETGLPADGYDLAFSFYVLEHVTWPHRFLREMLRIVKPNGLVMIECPHFRPRGRIPSLRYGKRILPLKDKIRSGFFLDGFQHLYDRNIHYPRVLRRRFPKAKFPFLINLEPSCLQGDFYPDNDAVYFVDRDEVVAELSSLGAADVTMEILGGTGLSGDLERCFIAVRKLNRHVK